MSVPWQPKGFSSGLDESYAFALYKAFADNFQFGKDFVYTYGPYGILHQDRYFPGTYTALVIGRAFVGLVIGVGLLRIAMHCWQQSRWSTLFLIPVFVSLANLGIRKDSMHIYCILLPMLLYFYVDNSFATHNNVEVRYGDEYNINHAQGSINNHHENQRNSSAPKNRFARLLSLLLLVIGVALISLIKHTLLVLGAAIVVLITIDQVARKRQAPIVLGTYLASLLGFWLLAGQRLAYIGPYITHNAQITKGFSETMGLYGPNIEIVLYLVTASVISVVIAITTWQRQNIYRMLPILGLLLALFLAFKGAFTRHDGHAIQSSESIIPLASLYSALLWPRLKSISLSFSYLKRFGVKLKIPALLLMWTLVIINAQLISSRYSETIYRDRYFGAIGKISNTISHAIKVTTGKADLTPIYEQSAQRVRADNPLPKTEGTTDLYPNNLAVLLAHGLSYRPRPVIQSFSAYTAELANLNAASLEGSDAPETILFDIRTIDERLPSSDDGRSWPSLWTHYRIVDASGSFLVLKRKPNPEAYEIAPLREQTADLGEWIDVADISSSALIWMTVDIDPTVIGKAMTTLFKRPPLYLDLELSNGGSQRYRVLDDVMHAGQLLSPAITERGEFAYLASEEWQKTLAFSAVTRMRLVTEGVSAAAYPATYTLNLNSLDFPRQELSDIPGWETIKGFTTLRSGNITSSNDKWATVRRGIEGSNILLSQPGVKITLPLPQNSQQLSISYGLQEEAWKRVKEEGVSADIDGVEFRILAISADETAGKTETVLFSQWLDPHVNEADRGKKRVTLPIQKLVNTEIVLETLSGPENNSDWDLSYWAELDIQ